MIFHKNDRVPAETTGGLDTVAIRFPSNMIAQALIKASGGYIAAPSANRSGRPSPTLARYCMEDLDGRVEMVIDGGQVGIGLESTIIDLTEEEPVILRPGFITQKKLAQVLGNVDVDRTIITPDSGIAPKAPGMKYRHYAPKGELVILEGSRGNVVAEINKAAAKDRENGIRSAPMRPGICIAQTASRAPARGETRRASPGNYSVFSGNSTTKTLGISTRNPSGKATWDRRS